MFIEEVERIMGETIEAIEYQKVWLFVTVSIALQYVHDYLK